VPRPAASFIPTSYPRLLAAEQRWLVCSNVDSQRLFDEELDGLGFQLKEWPWHWNRTQYLTDLVQGKAFACDRPLGDGRSLSDSLVRLRRVCRRTSKPVSARWGRRSGTPLKRRGGRLPAVKPRKR